MEDILYELEIIRDKKVESIRSQDFLLASSLRDSEKAIFRKIMDILDPNISNEWTSDEMVYERISNYLKLKYGIFIPIKNIMELRFKEVIRELKLKKIGL